MKILLDKTIDIRLKAGFPDNHEVYTVCDMMWLSNKDKALLQLLAEHHFDCWIEVDKNIPYQQNVATLPCLVIVMDVFRNTLKHLNALLPRLLDTLAAFTEERVIIIGE